MSFTGHTVFEGNNADSGGAIYALNGVKVAFSIMSISFEHNTAHADGGAIYALRATIMHFSSINYCQHTP